MNKERYEKQLQALDEFPIWTIEQIKEYLHMDFDTVQKMVDEKWLYKFSVSRCTFYSVANKKFTNQAIIKSILSIDAMYQLDYSKFDGWLVRNDSLYDKSLISRGVRRIGYLDDENRFNLYQVIVPQILTEKDFPKMAKLLIDIHNNNESDYIQVVFVVRNDDPSPLEAYLEEQDQLIPYVMAGYIKFQAFSFYRSHFDYLKL